MKFIKVNESQANKNNAEAATTGASKINIEANTETTNALRAYLVENSKQEGIKTWLENVWNNHKMMNKPGEGENGVISNSTYKLTTAITSEGGFNQELSTALLKTMAETGNLGAQELLTKEKAKGYWQELMNATIEAKASAMQANASLKNAETNVINAITNRAVMENDKVRVAAYKLAMEWDTGEFTNWKTWVDTSMKAVDSGVKAVEGIKNIFAK